MWQLIVMYILLLPCVALFIRVKQQGDKRVSVSVKALCIGIIVLTAAIGLAATPDSARLTAVLILMGLAFGMAGDVSICFKLEAGMLFFGLGHCFYIASLCRLSTHLLAAIPIFIILYALVIILFRISHLSLGNYKIPGLLYAAMLLAMLSVAATLPFSLLPVGAVLFVGALLFVASDTMLAWSVFGETDTQPEHTVMNSKSKTLDAVCLWCYFLGQSLFAVAIYLLQ